LYNEAAGYQGKGNADAEDEGGDAVDKRDKWKLLPRADFESVRDVECSHEESGAGDDLPE
jgi:hypothetical protein